MEGGVVADATTSAGLGITNSEQQGLSFQSSVISYQFFWGWVLFRICVMAIAMLYESISVLHESIAMLHVAIANVK